VGSGKMGPMSAYETFEVHAPLTLEEYKAQLVTVPGKNFALGRTPVTVGMWQEFCQATGNAMPYFPDYPVWKKGWDTVRDHPIIRVTWDDCTAYAEWAGLALPRAEQREFAARGGLTDKLYPWGDEEPKDQLWWQKTSNRTGTAPVQRSYHVFVNGYGLVDMAGNVWEWCTDWYEKDKYRVLCGGSWFYDDADDFRCAFRGWYSPSYQSNDFGFRLCSAH